MDLKLLLILQFLQGHVLLQVWFIKLKGKGKVTSRNVFFIQLIITEWHFSQRSMC